MTDRTPGPVGAVPDDVSFAAAAAPDPAGNRDRRRHGAGRARIAVAGVGVAAMLGLAGNMEFTKGRSQPAAPARSSVAASQRTIVFVQQGAAPGSVAADSRRPIVLTVHAAVRTVSAPAAGGSGGGSGYVSSSASGSGGSAAPASAAAPVASTSGSH